MSHRKPVDSVSSERNTCHVQRSRVHQANTSKELQKSGHPESRMPTVRFSSGLRLRRPKSAWPPRMKYPTPGPKNPIVIGQKGEFANVKACVHISISQLLNAVIVMCNCSTTIVSSQGALISKVTLDLPCRTVDTRSLGRLRMNSHPHDFSSIWGMVCWQEKCSLTSMEGAFDNVGGGSREHG
jgi:hypothetical protein